MLATFALGSYLKGSKTKPIALSLDLDGPASHSFSLSAAATPQPGAGPVSGAPAAQGENFRVSMSLKLRGSHLPVRLAFVCVRLRCG